MGASSVAGSTGRDLGDRGPGGHDQWPAGARKHRAERLDDASIGFAIRRELREVVVEREVDDAVRAGGAVLQAVRIVDRSAIDLGPRGGKSRRLLVRTIEADHLMARRDQLLDDARADESSRASDKYTHEQTSMFVE